MTSPRVIRALKSSSSTRSQIARRTTFETNTLRDQHLVSAAIRGLQSQRHCTLFAGRGAQPLRARQPRAPALCLAAVLARDVAAYVNLFRGNDLLLRLERALLREPSLRM